MNIRVSDDELIQHVKRSVAIEILEAHIFQLEAQNRALQAHNTELLFRARAAERLVLERALHDQAKVRGT